MEEKRTDRGRELCKPSAPHRLNIRDFKFPRCFPLGSSSYHERNYGPKRRWQKKRGVRCQIRQYFILKAIKERHRKRLLLFPGSVRNPFSLPESKPNGIVVKHEKENMKKLQHSLPSALPLPSPPPVYLP